MYVQLRTYQETIINVQEYVKRNLIKSPNNVEIEKDKKTNWKTKHTIVGKLPSIKELVSKSRDQRIFC